MNWILTLALLYLASAEGSDHSGLPPILTNALDLGSKQCDLIFDITKEDRENFKYFTVEVTERFQRYLFCQFLIDGMIETAFTLHPGIEKTSVNGRNGENAKTFVDCFYEAKENAGDAPPYIVTWNAVECLAEKMRGQ